MFEAVPETLAQFVTDHSREGVIFGGFSLYVICLFAYMWLSERRAERKLLKENKEESRAVPSRKNPQS